MHLPESKTMDQMEGKCSINHLVGTRGHIHTNHHLVGKPIFGQGFHQMIVWWERCSISSIVRTLNFIPHLSDSNQETIRKIGYIPSMSDHGDSNSFDAELEDYLLSHAIARDQSEGEYQETYKLICRIGNERERVDKFDVIYLSELAKGILGIDETFIYQFKR